MPLSKCGKSTTHGRAMINKDLIEFIRFILLENLMANKRGSGRVQDIADLENLP